MFLAVSVFERLKMRLADMAPAKHSLIHFGAPGFHVAPAVGGGGGRAARKWLQEPLSDSAADQAAQRRVSVVSSGDIFQESCHGRHWQNLHLDVMAASRALERLRCFRLAARLVCRSDLQRPAAYRLDVSGISFVTCRHLCSLTRTA